MNLYSRLCLRINIIKCIYYHILVSFSFQDIGENVYTIQEVIDEVTNRRQLRHLSVLTYDLIIKDVFVENIKFVTEFSKKTGDYLSLSATDIKVIALAYQLEKEKVGIAHLNEEPKIQRIVTNRNPNPEGQKPAAGFFQPPDNDEDSEDDTLDPTEKLKALDSEVAELESTLGGLKVDVAELDSILAPVDKMDDTTNHNDESDEGMKRHKVFSSFTTIIQKVSDFYILAFWRPP